MTTIDTLILGQGLVGSLLALSLIQKGQSVLVIDNGHTHSSTKVAAGMMNPIIGKRFSKLFQSDTEKDFVLSYYHDLEKIVGASFLKYHRLLRVIEIEDQLKIFRKRVSDPSFKSLLSSTGGDDLSAICQMGLFHYSLDQVPQLDTLTFLEASQSFLMSHSAYKKECFHYDELEILETSVRWKGVEAKKVVFCEGAQGVNNPIFQDLEFENAFGDIVDLVSSDIPEKIILNHGKWCCPLEKKGCFRYGSTSYWEDTEDNRKEGVEDLKNRLNRFLKVSYRIEKIHHGVRPVLKDRSPFAGPHPKYSHLFMINGMGGQGCSKAPLVISKFLNAGYLD